MGMNANPLAAYRETRVKTASPAQLVVMLYDEAVKQCDIAIGLMKNDIKKSPQNIEKINKALGKVQDIVTELMAGLDFDAGGDIADDLFALYVWFGRQLLDDNLRKDVSAVETIRKMLDELRGAWTEAAVKVQSVADMPSASVGVNIAG
jgi:flagellar secretion chaperone FliS